MDYMHNLQTEIISVCKRYRHLTNIMSPHDNRRGTTAVWVAKKLLPDGKKNLFVCHPHEGHLEESKRNSRINSRKWDLR